MGDENILYLAPFSVCDMKEGWSQSWPTNPQELPGPLPLGPKSRLASL